MHFNAFQCLDRQLEHFFAFFILFQGFSYLFICTSVELVLKLSARPPRVAHDEHEILLLRLPREHQELPQSQEISLNSSLSLDS